MTRLSSLEWNEEKQYFSQDLFGSKYEDPSSLEKGVELNEKTLQLLEALQQNPLDTIRQIAKRSRLPLSTCHRILQNHKESIVIRGDLSPEHLNATTLLCLKTGLSRDSVKKLEKIILPKDRSKQTISKLRDEGFQVWQTNRIVHRFSALTYQLLARDGFPYPLWGFLFREFLKGQRQATIFPSAPFEELPSNGPLFDPFEKPLELIETIKDLRKPITAESNSIRLELVNLNVIQKILSLHISSFNENALIIFDFEKKDLLNQTSRALLELPYVTLFEAQERRKNQRTLLCWLTCEEGGVFQLQDELSQLGFTDSITVFID
ncbi:MAG: helix-turn-helix domain-containing protein [Candidatus Ranarchaeia archaeon]